MKLRKILIVTNIITLFSLIVIALYYQVPYKVFAKMGIIKNNTPVYSYLHYDLRNNLFSEYADKEYHVVMLGDSITEGTAWNELLGIPDIANRGIDGDTTAGFHKRLSGIYKINPKVCFIMGGINDIVRGIPINQILKNMEKITNELMENGITPVMQSTLYVATGFPDWAKVNEKVDQLNAGLNNLCIEKGILFIDLNKTLSINGALKTEYTYDSLHLSGLGYKEWGKIIAPLIQAF